MSSLLRHRVLVASLVTTLSAVAGCRNNHPPANNGPPTEKPRGALVIQTKDNSEDYNLDVKCDGTDRPLELVAKLVDGKTSLDVTDRATWKSAEPWLVKDPVKGVVRAVCPLLHGGKVQITAFDAGLADVFVSLNLRAPDVRAKDAPANAADFFKDPPPGDPPDQPEIVYPIDGAMHAVNIGQITLQWLVAGNLNQLYRIHAVGPHIDASFYVGKSACTDNPDPKAGGMRCDWMPPAESWRVVTDSARGETVTVTISGTRGFNMPVTDSSPVNLQFSPETVRGGLYYFSPKSSGIKRLPFGSSVATDFLPGGKYTCVGCHAVSADGTKVAATFNGGDGTGGVVDGSDPNKFIVPPEATGSSAVRRWNYATFNPDGTRLLTGWDGVLTLRDEKGQKKREIPVDTICPNKQECTGQAIMPDWSPDGNWVAFVQVPVEGKIGSDFANSCLIAGDWDCGNVGSIAVMRFASDEFSPAVTVVPSERNSEYHYFPSWSPDSNWILFVSARSPGNSPTAVSNLYCSNDVRPPPGYVWNYDQDTARLRLVSASGGAPIDLINATHEADRTSSWPRFAPFLQQSRIAFFTFSSKFNYGWKVTDGNPQLWMSAVDLQLAAQGQGNSDPSYPPVWLPFQDPKESNHSGIWTQEITCVRNDDCGSQAICVGGKCVSTGRD